VNSCVLSILIATLLQHLTDLNKKIASQFEGGDLAFWQHALMLAFLPYFQSKSSVFVVLTGLEPVTSPM
jgi:hypothetical protein